MSTFGCKATRVASSRAWEESDVPPPPPTVLQDVANRHEEFYLEIKFIAGDLRLRPDNELLIYNSLVRAAWKLKKTTFAHVRSLHGRGEVIRKMIGRKIVCARLVGVRRMIDRAPDQNAEIMVIGGDFLGAENGRRNSERV